MKRLLAVALAAACFPAIRLAGVENLLRNGDFEAQTAHWESEGNGNDSITVSSLQKMDGQSALSVRLAAGHTAEISQIVPVNYNQPYQLRFQYFTGNIESGGMHIVVTQLGNRRQPLGILLDRAIPHTVNVWNEHRFDLSPVKLCDYLKITFRFTGPLTQPVYLDSVTLSKSDGRPKSQHDAYRHLYPDDRELYETLIEPVRERKIYPFWSYAHYEKEYAVKGLILGFDYSMPAEFRRAGEYNLAPWAPHWFRNYPELARQSKVPLLLYVEPDAREAQRRGTLGILPNTDPANPAFFNRNDPKYLAFLEYWLNRGDYPDVPMIYFIGDEWSNVSTTKLPDKARRLQNPFWQQVEKETLATYGFGKYGVPDSVQDKNPFKRIAYLRQQAAMSAETFRKIYDAVKKRYPNALVLSTDEWAHPTPEDFELRGQACDLQAGQTMGRLDGATAFGHSMLTKLYRDLGKRPVYPYLQVTRYPNKLSPEVFRDYVSSAFQGGASGIFVGVIEWHNTDLTQMEYAAPDNWRAFLDFIKRSQNFEIKVPQDKNLAFHYSTYSWMARWEENTHIMEGAYGVLGPLARSWFTFTDDLQIERNPATWDDYKTVFITDNAYFSDAMKKAVERFLARGGTLVIADPGAFSTNIDGTDESAWKQQLTGVKFGKFVPHQSVRAHDLSAPLAQPKGFDLTVADPGRVRTVATYEDGQPAVVEHRVGKGKVWFFGFQPFPWRAEEWPKMVALFRQFLVRDWQAAIDYPIWRFRFPAPRPAPDELSGLVCLTGNDLRYVSNTPDTSRNRNNVHGSYRYAVPPRAIPDVEEPTFATGKLTNTLHWLDLPRDGQNALKDRDGVHQFAPWAVLFGRSEAGPNTVTFDLGSVYETAALRLFFAGTLPKVTVRAGVSPGNMEPVAAIPVTAAGTVDPDGPMCVGTRGSRALTIKFTAPTSARYVQLSWDKPAGTELALGEISLWSKPPQN